MKIHFSNPSRKIGRKPTKQITTSSEYLGELPPVPQGPATFAGAHLHRRYHVPAGIADLLALLAGIGEQEGR